MTRVAGAIRLQHLWSRLSLPPLRSAPRDRNRQGKSKPWARGQVPSVRNRMTSQKAPAQAPRKSGPSCRSVLADPSLHCCVVVLSGVPQLFFGQPHYLCSLAEPLTRPDATTPDAANRGPVVLCLRAPTSAETLPFYSPGPAHPPRGSARGRRFRRPGFGRTPPPPASTPRRTGHRALGGTRESQAARHGIGSRSGFRLQPGWRAQTRTSLD